MTTKHNDSFLDSILSITQIENEFKSALSNAIKNNDLEAFKHIFQTHEENHLNDSDDTAKRLKRAKYRIQIFFDFIERNERTPELIEHLLPFFGQNNFIAKSNLLLGLWFYEKDELVLNLLENDIYCINDKNYESFHCVLNPNTMNPNLPLGSEEKKHYFNERKNQFLLLQKQYGLKINLDRHLPEKDNNRKSFKL